jgi:hypothetical protein
MGAIRPFVPFALALLLVGCGATTKSSSPDGTHSAEPAGPTSSDVVPGDAASAAPSAAASSAATASAVPSSDTPKPTKSFVLSEHGLPLAIDLPEDAEVGRSQSKDGLGGATIDAKNISLRITKANAKVSTVAAAKATLQKLAHRPATKFLKEEAALLVYERGEGDVYFMAWKKAGAVTYVCQSLGGVSNEDALSSAVAACGTLKKAP